MQASTLNLFMLASNRNTFIMSLSEGNSELVIISIRMGLSHFARSLFVGFCVGLPILSTIYSQNISVVAAYSGRGPASSGLCRT